MKIRSGINPATISAITMMLQPHIPEISPQSLIAALKNYGNSTETKKCSAQRPLTRAEAAKLLSVTPSVLRLPDDKNPIDGEDCLERKQLHAWIDTLDPATVRKLLRDITTVR